MDYYGKTHSFFENEPDCEYCGREREESKYRKGTCIHCGAKLPKMTEWDLMPPSEELDWSTCTIMPNEFYSHG